ncbi:hypothetical protein [Bacillus sp. UNC41MFS5]|uniref:hypothetical protein n=1 Tax=Bacillus sp. UNC41MFS5 TaxID=1449046 RepID=UPI00047ED44B|nr:hypothetical protein [Bacillus sp. UNC41MFS5]
MKKFFIILIAIVLSAPLSSLLSLAILNFNIDDNYEWGNAIFVAAYEVLIYFICGIPVTLLIDFVIKLTVVSNTKKLYLFQFLLYSLAAGFFGLYLNWNNVEMIIIAIIAIYTYFHILFFLRKRFMKE